MDIKEFQLVSFYVNREEYKQLKILCANKCTTVREALNIAISDYIKKCRVK